MDDQIKSAQLNIRDLVSQVKSGELDKNTAFNNLQNILRANSGGEGGGPETEDGQTGGEGELGDDLLSQNTGKISQEDRRMLINKLIEKKRQNRSDADDDAKEPKAWHFDHLQQRLEENNCQAGGFYFRLNLQVYFRIKRRV